MFKHLNLRQCTTLGALAVAVALAPQFAQAQMAQSSADNEYKQEVLNQLYAIQDAPGMGNYYFDDYTLDSLAPGESDRISVYLEAGYTYSFVGVCDRDCGDVDLYLEDSNGNEIDFDDEDDDFPVVEVTPRWSDYFVVEMVMYDCSADYCYYGVGQYSR